MSLLQVTDLQKYFPTYSQKLLRKEGAPVKAVDGLSLKLDPGETLGLVGESGCMASNLASSVSRPRPCRP